jgi:MerR family transcriptional regulator, thiopeptide resistance regulator
VPAPQRIIPILVYEDIEAAHDFLVDAFGFAPGGVQRDADGHVVHGEVIAEEGPIWLHRVTPAHDLASPRTMDVATGGLVIHVPDVDAHCERARAAGARVERDPADQEYGQREYGVRDLEGHRWWFATPLR